MDKFKIYLAAAAKYQFWILCGAVLLISLGCWWMATKDLATKFVQRKAAIDGDFNKVVIHPNDPNEDVVKKINEQRDLLNQGVLSAWGVLYKEETEKNPFPAVKVLGEDFKKQFEDLRFRPKEELARPYRERYQTKIQTYLPELKVLIDVLHPKEPRAGNGDHPADPVPPGRTGGMMSGGPGLGAGEETEWVGIVDWKEDDYNNLVGHFDWQEAPSTLAVVLAQEDLWVYESLLRVIKSANEGATSQNNATVKQITRLAIGREAIAAWKEAENAVFTSKQGSPGAASGPPGIGPGPAGVVPGGPGPGPGGPGPGPGGPGGAKTGSLDSQLVDGRYVDDKGQPLPASEPEYPYVKGHAEFKMLPICMNLVVDGRRLPQLLVELDNSNMPIEIRRIRILKDLGQPTDLGTPAPTAGAGGPSGAAYGPGGYPPPGRGPRGPVGAPVGRPGNQPDQEAGPNDLPVEIQAVVYIYNPPPPAANPPQK
jgi:hypothetical protein